MGVGGARTGEAECDLLVVGSGAAGLAAAATAAWHGLRVIVVEKDAVCGGATAWSGGWMWVPLNPLSQADGIVEDPQLPRTYLPAGGINIGPAMTFGYIAGRHAAGATDYENVVPTARNDGI